MLCSWFEHSIKKEQIKNKVLLIHNAGDRKTFARTIRAGLPQKAAKRRADLNMTR
jgi:hypothetical protein